VAEAAPATLIAGAAAVVSMTISHSTKLALLDKDVSVSWPGGWVEARAGGARLRTLAQAHTCVLVVSAAGHEQDDAGGFQQDGGAH
jgi:hypothetical protein